MNMLRAIFVSVSALVLFLAQLEGGYAVSESLRGQVQHSLSTQAGYAGKACWAGSPCPNGFSCHPGYHECYNSPRLVDQPCSAGYECEDGLYCASHKCKSPPYTDITPAGAAYKDTTKGTKDFHMLIVSDIQFYYGSCPGESQQNPVLYGECVNKDIGEEGRESYDNGKLHAAFQSAAKEMVNYMKTLISDPKLNVQGIINNGDLTNDGDELSDEIEYFADSSISGVPIFHNLGNHDVYYNKPWKMIGYMRNKIKELGHRSLVSAVDFQESEVLYDSAEASRVRLHRGSMSYAYEREGYVFIHTHWGFGERFIEDKETRYITTTKANYWHYGRSGVPGSGEDYDHRRDFFTITPPIRFLINELAKASAAKKPVILVPHGAQLLRARLRIDNGLKKILESSTVMAIFSGHIHQWWNFQYNITFGKDGKENPSQRSNIPVIYSGGLQFQKFLKVKFEAGGKGIKVTLMDSKRQKECDKTIAGPRKVIRTREKDGKTIKFESPEGGPITYTVKPATGSKIGTWKPPYQPLVFPIPYQNYNMANFLCTRVGKKLCTYEQLCPYGLGISTADAQDGSDQWVAIDGGNGQQDWVQVGTHPYVKPCGKHSTKFGTPSWGQTFAPFPWRDFVVCC